MNLYLDIDPKSCAWTQGLIDAGEIPHGKVECRPIQEVKPHELTQYTQCHFCNGISGWSLALRLAGITATRRLWTASLPCQPFSVAGRRKGEEDERHLWPWFRELVAECHPSEVIGEQVSSKDGREWLAGIQADLEAMEYAFGAVDTCAPGIRAPHIRQRLYWGALRGTKKANAGRMADADGGESGDGELQCGWEQRQQPEDGVSRGLAEPVPSGERRGRICGPEEGDGQDGEWASGESSGCSSNGGLEHPAGDRRLERRAQPGGRGATGGCGDGGMGNASGAGLERRQSQRRNDGQECQAVERTGSELGWLADSTLSYKTRFREQPEHISGPRIIGRDVRDHWSNSAWHLCRDGRRRRIPLEAQSFFQCVADGLPSYLDEDRAECAFPLAQKVEGRVPLLKGYGNAIVAPLAAEFIRSFYEAMEDIKQ